MVVIDTGEPQGGNSLRSSSMFLLFVTSFPRGADGRGISRLAANADNFSGMLRCLRAPIVRTWTDLVFDHRAAVADAQCVTLSKDANKMQQRATAVRKVGPIDHALRLLHKNLSSRPRDCLIPNAGDRAYANRSKSQCMSSRAIFLMLINATSAYLSRVTRTPARIAFSRG